MTHADREAWSRTLDALGAMATGGGNETNATTPPVANSSAGAGNSSSDAEAATDNRFWALAMLLVPLCTIFGNALVVLAVRRERALQTATNRFIVSLAVADILVAAIVMPVSVCVEFRSGLWDFNYVLCDLWIMCDALFSTASILNLVAISIDRFMAVTRPIHYSKHRNTRRTRVTIGATWLLSACIALPIGCGLQDASGLRRRREFANVCTFLNADFLIYSSLGSFYIPCCVMVVLYYRIFTAIRRRARTQLAARLQPRHSDAPPQTQASASDNSGVGSDTGDTRADSADRQRTAKQNRFFRLRLHRPRHGLADRSAARRERKATKTLAIVLGVFLLCWLPFFITNLLWAACLKNIDDSFFHGPLCDYDRRISVFIVWLGYMNSFMNPVIYTIFNNDFRKAFKRLLRIT